MGVTVLLFEKVSRLRIIQNERTKVPREKIIEKGLLESDFKSSDLRI
jgi:hypothetical protein